MENKKALPGINLEEIRKMRDLDIRTVDKEMLVDIKDVKINTKLPDKERITDFLDQIKNPYCYLDNGIVVKISFSGNQRLEDILSNCMLQDK